MLSKREFLSASASQWNDAYRDKLTFFLSETAKRGIIVQLTLWDHFDISGSRWKKHPWNPENNINMEAGIVDGDKDLFASNKKEVLHYKEQYIDRLLDETFRYDHIIYNINNESQMAPEWENYWAAYVKRRAAIQGRDVHITNMKFNPSDSLRHVLTYPDLYSYVDISQNNQDSLGGRGPAHWDNIEAMTMLLEKLDIFSCTPHNDLVSARVPVQTVMEAYCTANIGRQYAIYFPAGRYTMNFDPWIYAEELNMQWLDIDRGEWSKKEVVEVIWEGGTDDWGDRGVCVASAETGKSWPLG